MKVNTALPIVLMAASSAAFAPMPTTQRSTHVQSAQIEAPFFIEVEQEPMPTPPPRETNNKRAMSPPPSKRSNPAHKEGVFSPVVYAFKDILGDQTLNKVRAKAISYHSDAIKNFVSTANSDFGESVLKILFKAADKNGNGQIEEEELEAALQTLGFRWLEKKQIQGIFNRAGGKEKGYITLNEWMKEAPKTLKTNLIKLAKTNGGDMGFLV